jgi:hypothetical protein
MWQKTIPFHTYSHWFPLQSYSIITIFPNKIEGNFTPFLHRFYTKIHLFFIKNAHFIEEKGEKTAFC